MLCKNGDGRTATRRGLCGACYERDRRSGRLVVSDARCSCGGTLYAKGRCYNCYMRAQRNGGIVTPPRVSAKAWLAAHLKAEPTEQCVLWPFAVNQDGYPVYRGGRPAHIVLAADGRPRPGRLHALHSRQCISRACLNARHLRWGNEKENANDAIMLGRHNAHRGFARLDADKVRALRAAHAAGGTSYTELARRYGVTPLAVSQAVRRITWAHVD